MPEDRTANDIAWRKYIAESGVRLDGSTHTVTATQLKEITDREPRLLTKFDNPRQIPNVLRENHYSVLAVANGEYLLFQGNIFAETTMCMEHVVYQSQIEFPLTTIGRGTGESEYLDNAFNSGIISDFTRSGRLYLTIRGRERTGPFEFEIGASNLPISVNGVQIEADAGYEGASDIILIEAKIGRRSHFNIRQLYYPFRHFTMVARRKRIRNLFFEYDLSQATYALYEFVFDHLGVFDSIRQTRCCVYSLTCPETHQIDDLLDVRFETTSPTVPQADDLNKVLELLTLINRGQGAVDEIADHFVFEPRQSNYYGEAAEYLGLITRYHGEFELTEKGSELLGTPPEEQQLYVAKLIVNSWIFRDLIRTARRKGFFANEDIEEIIASVKTSRNQQRYTSSTVSRRRLTIVAWAKWLAEQIGVLKFEDGKFFLA